MSRLGCGQEWSLPLSGVGYRPGLLKSWLLSGPDLIVPVASQEAEPLNLNAYRDGS
jgi:hypothetical protein